MDMDAAWNTIDEGLKDLMDNNDQLSDRELIGKSKRLRHLGKFVETLAKRVDERIREGVAVGAIGPLFDKYIADRLAVDGN